MGGEGGEGEGKIGVDKHLKGTSFNFLLFIFFSL